jgi:endoglycosylceramidase
VRRAAALTALTLVAAWSAQARAAQEPPRVLSFLHVGAPAGPAALPQILDDAGREVLLAGVNVDGLVDYWRPDLRAPYPGDPAAYAGDACPPDDPSVEGVPVCRFDAAQMRPLGFDAVRLNLSWSLLEPDPGSIDGLYVDRIAQVVGWLKAQGIFTVLDLHQDAWSKYVFSSPGDPCAGPFQAIPGADGAPRWASAHALPACALNGVRELDPAVAEDFQRLYDDAAAPDGKGLQEHYAQVLVALARRFADEPAVAGYEILNEPSPGYLAPSPAMDTAELFPFYARMVGAVTTAVPGFRQLFFIEPSAVRNVTDRSDLLLPWSGFSAYPNVVYAPHVYTGVFTADQQVASRRLFPADGGYRSAIADARRLGLPLWVGEFGNDPADDDTLLRTSYELQDRYGVAGTLWLWKENGRWGVEGPPFGPGTPQEHRLRYVARPFPLAVAGELRRYAYDVDRRTLDLRATARRVAFRDRARATVLFVPAAVTAGLRAEHARLEVFDRGGGAREAYVYPRGGPYRVVTAQAAGALKDAMYPRTSAAGSE